MNFAIGLVIAVGSVIGGYAALGGHLEVLTQPFEFVIICGASLGVFIIGNTFATIKDSGKAIVEAITDKAPKPRDFLDVLSVMHALMRELRAKSRSEVEGHFDNPKNSEIFKGFPKLLGNADLVVFICDYCRLIIIGNAKTSRSRVRCTTRSTSTAPFRPNSIAPSPNSFISSRKKKFMAHREKKRELTAMQNGSVDRSAQERMLADAMVEVATELRLADLTELFLMIRSEQAANIADLINSSSELFFKNGALKYALSAGCELRWESAPTVQLDLEFRHATVTVFFRLTIGRARAGVEVLDVFFEGDDYLGSVSEKERLCAAISDARLR